MYYNYLLVFSISECDILESQVYLMLRKLLLKYTYNYNLLYFCSIGYFLGQYHHSSSGSSTCKFWKLRTRLHELSQMPFMEELMNKFNMFLLFTQWCSYDRHFFYLFNDVYVIKSPMYYVLAKSWWAKVALNCSMIFSLVRIKGSW